MVQLLVTTIFLRVLTFVLSNSVASSDGYLCSQVCNLLDFYQRTIKTKDLLILIPIPTQKIPPGSVVIVTECFSYNLKTNQLETEL